MGPLKYKTGLTHDIDKSAVRKPFARHKDTVNRIIHFNIGWVLGTGVAFLTSVPSAEILTKFGTDERLTTMALSPSIGFLFGLGTHSLFLKVTDPNFKLANFGNLARNASTAFLIKTITVGAVSSYFLTGIVSPGTNVFISRLIGLILFPTMLTVLSMRDITEKVHRPDIMQVKDQKEVINDQV